jgi:hypothetical protein
MTAPTLTRDAQVLQTAESLFYSLLTMAGIRRNRSWHEYERGKRIIESQACSPAEYQQMIAWLCKWVRV